MTKRKPWTRRCSRWFGALLFLALPGCFSYVPPEGFSLERGTPVRAELSVPMDIRLTALSLNDANRIYGEVIEQSADTLYVSALSLQSASGISLEAAGETLRIPLNRIASIERRRLDGVRSAAVVGIAGIVSAALIAILQGDGEGGRGGGGPNPQPQ